MGWFAGALEGCFSSAGLAAGAEVIGVIPQQLMEREQGHRHLTELHIVRSMHERKALMSELADGFIALPGGYGTFEEFCEILTWAQLGLHQKPCGLLNAANYYEHLIGLFDHALAEGLLKARFRSLVIEADKPAELLERMEKYHGEKFEKLISESEV